MNISTKSILHVCCAKGRCEMVKLLLNSGAFIHVRDKWGQTALMYCMVCQFVEVAEILLMNDSSVADDQDSFGKSALHIAVESGNIDSVKMFINHGANLDIQNIEGYTPLMLSCYSDQADREILNQMLQLLVDSGADIHIRERRSRRTALQVQISSKHGA
ncbi:hypothetical protein LOTGIDRAFT_109659 [Lottia gigantea]|uniref:Uncharacterized protein n=1 Tax=Lottia gigantea TaxID=225164 RepID=V4AL70_LOTGI|nr:hypothetical protein LOTGIDRAFT_109659 [Lottia gigantea]ESP04939.1 hypothetical protein LOTGIDRAFT_109659 [Lottia gigantea]